MLRTPAALDAGMLSTTVVRPWVLLCECASSPNDDGCSAPTATSELDVDLRMPGTLPATWNVDLRSCTILDGDDGMLSSIDGKILLSNDCSFGGWILAGLRATRLASLAARLASPGSRRSPPLSAIAIWL
eukprot:3796499-Prymnesium_polylepis.2